MTYQYSAGIGGSRSRDDCTLFREDRTIQHVSTDGQFGAQTQIFSHPGWCRSHGVSSIDPRLESAV